MRRRVLRCSRRSTGSPRRSRSAWPDWSVDPGSAANPQGVLLQMRGAKGTRFVAARIMASDDLEAFQVTLRVNQLPTMP